MDSMENDELAKERRAPAIPRQSWITRYFRLTFLIHLSIVLLSSSLIWASCSKIFHRPTDHELITAINGWSPILDRRQLHLEQRWLKSAFVNSHNTPPSIFRQEPSKDVDAAWEYLHRNGRVFLITAEEVERLGKNPKAAVIAPEAWHNGEEKYIAITQSSHDLHCLNMIRRGMFKDYYFNGTMSWALEQHLMHCLHSLLQSLQCRYSTDIYLSAWVEGQDFAVVDFNISRQCLSYDAYMNEWRPETEHPEGEFYKLRAPPGAIFQPASVF
ncbi:hypothetical protein TgHK011_006998 [Trichoderma gracile]|nr:hypothetical protein TgHK011_006998 [Trichoderma gracile]